MVTLRITARAYLATPTFAPSEAASFGIFEFRLAIFDQGRFKALRTGMVRCPSTRCM